MRQVDCMACVAIGQALPMGTLDKNGVVHYVKWSTRGNKGCFRLCDFDQPPRHEGDEPRLNPRAVRVDLDDVRPL